jgi:hypothetical protein
MKISWPPSSAGDSSGQPLCSARAFSGPDEANHFSFIRSLYVLKTCCDSSGEDKSEGKKKKKTSSRCLKLRTLSGGLLVSCSVLLAGSSATTSSSSCSTKLSNIMGGHRDDADHSRGQHVYARKKEKRRSNDEHSPLSPPAWC